MILAFPQILFQPSLQILTILTVQLNSIVSRSKLKWYKAQKGKKFALNSQLKPNYLKKIRSSSSLLFTEGDNAGQKWQWSTQEASSMS